MGSDKIKKTLSIIIFLVLLSFLLPVLPSYASLFDDPQIEKLLKLLKGDDYDKKAYAASALADKGDVRVLSQLIEEFNTKNNYFRAYVIKAVTDFGDAAIPLLIESCSSKNRLVRANSAIALGRLENDSAIPTLLSLFNDKKRSVRKNAVIAISSFQTKEIMDSLINLFNSERSAKNKTYIIEALGNYSNKEIILTLINATKQFSSNKDVYVRRAGVTVLGKIALLEGAGALIESLADPDEEIRGIARQGLINIGSRDKKGFKLLIDALNNKEPLIKGNAAAALGDIGNPEAVPGLIKLVSSVTEGEDESKAVLNTINALAKIKDPMAVDPLIVLLGTLNDSIRLAAVEALGAIGDKKAIPALLPVVWDYHEMVKVRAITVLGDFKAERAIDVLKKVAQKDKKEHIRTLAEDTIKRIRQ